MSVGHALPVAVATPQGHEVCKVCMDPATPHGRARVRSKYEAVFLRCNRCGFISIANPIWLPEAYASPINVSDTGYVARNLWSAERVRMIVELSRDPAGKFLDYAAGYGLLVRLMRDIGYDFRWADEYCENLFARCFEEPQPLAGTFEAITAFEVLEHLVDPMQTLTELAGLSSCLIVSTDLVPQPAPAPTEWWYYGLEHGQHVSFYSSSSLRVIADRLNLHLSTDGVSFHVFTRQPLPPHIFRRIDSRLWRAWVRRTRRRTSKREADHEIAVRLYSQSVPKEG